ncbi:hypothetical protein H2199_009125 [Coniosporium tulheliwenetii]|uniref:Uncharacterized protein n=1 Tax=Coniosporium tulheliwenetii TaxID=3383036 RepID=A0ACC2YFI1_9PEZI|nr:hypothetical protein H2199_009125 [Cladosporium sp. JES 115]
MAPSPPPASPLEGEVITERPEHQRPHRAVAQPADYRALHRGRQPVRKSTAATATPAIQQTASTAETQPTNTSASNLAKILQVVLDIQERLERAEARAEAAEERANAAEERANAAEARAARLA